MKVDVDGEGHVSVIIKPEDVLLSKDTGEFKAVIESIEFSKFLTKITLNLNGFDAVSIQGH